MKFGVREICDVVFKALQDGNMGSMEYSKGQPVLYIDSAKTSTIEGAATTVYAQGGRGNSRLIAWEGEKTLTFTVEDALLSEIGFAILSGAGLLDGDDTKNARIHCSEIVYASSNKLMLEHEPKSDSPVFVMKYENGSIGDKVSDLTIGNEAGTDGKVTYYLSSAASLSGQYFVDYYYAGAANKVTELNIDAENFAGYYYVEASTLFRRESDGKDLPAEIVFPKVKIQSNFTFSMASTGDPSTFTFTMDAMPAYTMFERTKKVLCAIQVIDDSVSGADQKAVMTLDTGETVELNDTTDSTLLGNDSI